MLAERPPFAPESERARELPPEGSAARAEPAPALARKSPGSLAQWTEMLAELLLEFLPARFALRYSDSLPKAKSASQPFTKRRAAPA